MKLVKYTKVYSVHVRKTINAPLKFVYDWCTDYQETDPDLTGSKTKRKNLLKTDEWAIYTESYVSGGKEKTAVDVVRLLPPKAWHLDYVGDEDDETGDYILTSLGPRKTRLDMTFTEHYKTAEFTPKGEFAKRVSMVWGMYAEALEKDYQSRP
jgi:hypothetical protein